jgi:hypothetical protein
MYSQNGIRICITGTIISTMAMLFLFPAIDNGFPFIFPDSGGYLGDRGLTHITGERPIYYTWFTRVLDLPIFLRSSNGQIQVKGWSPWPSVVLQSLITAWMIWLFASALFELTRASRLLSVALVLALGTSLPWFVGQILPDIFTPLMILALALLSITGDTLPRITRILLVLFISAAVAFHQANLLVALWMLPALGLCVLLGWHPSKASIHGALESGIALALGAAALLTANLVDGRFALSNGGSVLFMARLMDDGIVLGYLEKTCPQQRFAVCADLDELRSSFQHEITLPGCGSLKIPLSTYFLADVLPRLGGFRAEEGEAGAIVTGTLGAYPLAVARAAVGNAWSQLFSFRTGDTLCAFPEAPWSITIRKIFGQVVYDHYVNSKQSRGALRLQLLNYIHVTVLVASCLVLIIGFLVVGRLGKQPRAFFASLFVIVLVAGNAFTLGGLSEPQDRYQSRVIWLVPLLAACIVARRVDYRSTAASPV